MKMTRSQKRFLREGFADRRRQLREERILEGENLSSLFADGEDDAMLLLGWTDPEPVSILAIVDYCDDEDE